jgi:H+/Cl- antiporter ClcA
LAGEGEIIRNILQKNIQTTNQEMASFVAVWYLFTITTYGTNVPAGLFLPGMIIGCALGDLLFRL